MKRYFFTVVCMLISLAMAAQSGLSNRAPANVEAVDLGLPSGTKWANMNVGASCPEDYGKYFAWGETSPKGSYSWDNYMCPEMTCGKPGDPVFDLVGDKADISGTVFDAAKKNWGASWNMPTAKQVEELASNCYSSLVTINGVKCRKLTSSINGNEIILPLSGARWFEKFAYEGTLGYYWGSTLREGGYVSPCRMIIREDAHGWGWSMGGENDRFHGFPIRPVYVENSNAEETKDNKFSVIFNDAVMQDITTETQSGIGFARSSDGTKYSLSTDGKYNSRYDLGKIKYVNRYYEPDIHISTPEVDFGLVEIGVTKKYPVSVTNKGIFPEFIHAVCQGDFFIAPEDENFLLDPGQSISFDISYAPAGEKTSNGTLALTSSAMRGGSENVILRGIGTGFNPQAHVFPEVVTGSSDNAETVLCDTLNGKYTVSYEGEVPDVKEGNVVFVDKDSTTYIVLVTNVTRNGNVVSYEGKRGDLSYVFHDVSFTLSTAADDVLITRLNGKETNRRVKLGRSKRVKDTVHLFDKEKDFNIPIIKKGDAKLSVAGSFHPSLDCELHFEFYEPIHDVFEGIAFTKAGLFRSGVKLIGELKTECNLSVNVKKKSEKYEYDEKEPILVKENFLPKKNWDFMVFEVPVRVSFGCDLFEKAYMYCKGEFEMYEGFVNTITGTYGFSYDPNDYFNGYVPIKDVDIQFERTDPTVKGKLEAGLKAYLIPRFYARLYDLVGPCVELKPYFDVNVGGAFQEEFIDKSDNGNDTDYISTYLNASFGVDWGLGFSVLDEIEFKKFADKTWDMGKTFIDPVYLLKSPSDLLLTKESTKRIRKGQPIDLTFDAQCKFLGGSYSSPFFPVIKIDIPKRKYHTYLFTLGSGKADYKWIPQSDDEELHAMVYDKSGKAVKTIVLPNPDDNTMRAITEPATDVKTNSAVLHGKFDSGNTVVIDKMGFIYSSEVKVPTYFDENCKFVEVAFDDVMDKSCLVEGLKPGTTYYFRAYASNRHGSNYGNVLSFTTVEGQTSLQLSTTTLTLTPGQQATVDVTSGSGSYDAVSSAKNVATVTVSGSKLTIKGVSPGTSTITVKDNQTQERAKIEVTVKNNTSLQLSATSLTLTIGQQGTVDVTSGSGSYAAVSNAKDVATVSVEGSKIIIKAVSPGSATITVKDNQTQERAKIEVTVKRKYIPEGAVDLDLPSGLLWASCNVGASSPEESGGYYAWGETEEKDIYDIENYTFYNSSDNHCKSLKGISGTEYDVAHIKMDRHWRMPTVREVEELTNSCSMEIITYNDVRGRKLTGPNGNSIFFPFVGQRRGSYISGRNEGFYLVGTEYESEGQNSKVFVYLPEYTGGCYSSGGRYYGFSIRPVYDDRPLSLSQTSIKIVPGANGTVKIKSGSGLYTIVNNHPDYCNAKIVEQIDEIWINGNGGKYDSDFIVKISANKLGTSLLRILDLERNEEIVLTVYVVEDASPSEAIDLGLPSGTKWATCNVGASNPEEYGNLYAWGEIEPKKTYNYDNYVHKNESGYIDLGDCISGTDYDVAHVLWGGNWKIPTVDEMNELNHICSKEWTIYNGTNGIKYTGPNGNSIFLPAAGHFSSSVGWWSGQEESLYYWTGTRRTDFKNWIFTFMQGNFSPVNSQERAQGQSVRPVCH